jgi:hypothetical protein
MHGKPSRDLLRLVVPWGLIQQQKFSFSRTLLHLVFFPDGVWFVLTDQPIEVYQQGKGI